jgi:hypothetical protein
MSDAITESLPPVVRARIVERQLDDVKSQIQELTGAARGAKSLYRSARFQAQRTRFRLGYLSFAQFLRTRATAVFGWRWAVALVCTMLSGALIAILFASLWAGMFGIAAGALVFTALVTFPTDSQLIQKVDRNWNRSSGSDSHTTGDSR